MEAAKQAVGKFISRGGHHETEVEERVNPAVTTEVVKPHRHEETTQAVDREVHQDHYHTTVQPLEHQEVLPEKHTHQQMQVEEREYVHGDTNKIKEGFEAENAKFVDTTTTHPTTQTTSQGAAAAGEHVHHHVHETVQPVIHKETIQPEVVHTTIPVHETHHAQAEHHGISTLPTKTLSEFKELGGNVDGDTSRQEKYEGHPRPYNPALQSGQSGADVNPASHDGLHGSHETKSVTETSEVRTGTSESNVSGARDTYNTSSSFTSGGATSTGTALGGRAEGNTANRALDAATSHHESTGGDSMHTGTRGVGSESTAGRGLESTGGHDSTDHKDTERESRHADTSSSTDESKAPATKTTGSDDVQHAEKQGKDPSLVESGAKSSGWKGEGVPGSHSAVFGLTPDGKTYNDTTHGTTPLKPGHTPSRDNTATGDTGSRASTGGGVAEQMNDPKVAEKGHGGSITSTGTEKPGAGAPGGEQGFGQIRPEEQGGTSKIQDKVDPTTDADGDGKRGVMD